MCCLLHAPIKFWQAARNHTSPAWQVVGLGDERRPHALVHAPLAVIPVPFPRDSFKKAKAAMRVFNALIDRVARDGAYLRATLRPAAEFDDFTVRHALCMPGCILCLRFPVLPMHAILRHPPKGMHAANSPTLQHHVHMMQQVAQLAAPHSRRCCGTLHAGAAAAAV